MTTSRTFGSSEALPAGLMTARSFEATAVCDLDGAILLENETWKTLVASSSSDERVRARVCPTSHPAWDRAWIETRSSRGQCEIDCRFISVTGESIPVVVRLVQVAVQARSVMVVHALDQTRQKVESGRLEASEARFRLMAEFSVEVFWMFDLAAGAMFYISPGYESIWGRSCQSLYDDGRSFIDAIHVDDRTRVLETLERQSRGERTEVEYRVVRPDGAIRWIWDRGYPVADPDGEVRLVAGVAADVSDRRAAEDARNRSEEWYRRIVETASEGVWVLDSTAITTFVNSRMAEMLGYERLDMIGRSLLDFMDPTERTVAVDALVRRRLGLSERHDFRFRTRDGRSVWAVVSTSAILGDAGQFLGALGMVTDVTDRREAEDEIRRLNETMAEQVRLRTADLERLNAKLARQSCERDDVLAALKAELEGMVPRPSHSSGGDNCTVEPGSRAVGDEEAWHPTSREPLLTEHGARQLTWLVQDLNDRVTFERMSGEPQLSVCTLSSIVSAVVRGNRHDETRAQVSCVPEDFELLTELDVLVEMLRIAIRAVARHHGLREAIQVAIHGDPIRDCVNVSVSAARDSSTSADGSRLAALVRDAERLRRRVLLSSVPVLTDRLGGWLTVFDTGQLLLTLPWRRPPVVESLDGWHGRTVLIVGEPTTSRHRVHQRLQSMGFDVVVHPTLRGALKRLALAAPSVVVVESPLTDGWGEELIRQHRDAELPPVAFIVVSSREGGPSRSDGDNVVSLRRPCSIDDLTREIMKILGGDAHEARVRRHLHLVGADLPSRRTVADYLERRGFLVTVAESVPNTALPPGRHWDDVELGIFELNPPPHSAADGPTMGTASLRPILILDGQNDPSGLPIDPLHGAQKPSPPPNGLEELLELIRRRVEEAR